MASFILAAGFLVALALGIGGIYFARREDRKLRQK